MQHLQKTRGGGGSRLWSSPLISRHCSQTFSFHTLTYAFAPQENQLICFQEIPHILPPNWGYPCSCGPCLSIGRSLRTRISRPCRDWLGISAKAFGFNLSAVNLFKERKARIAD